MLDKIVKSGHPCLVPDLRKKYFNFSPLSMMIAMDLLDLVVIMLKCILSVLSLFDSFYHEHMLNFVKYFFCKI